MATTVAGVDLGSLWTRITLLEVGRKMPTVQRNASSNEATPSCISFPAGEIRLFGEGAGPKEMSRPGCTVPDLLDLAEGSEAAAARLRSRGVNCVAGTFGVDGDAAGDSIVYPAVDLTDAGTFEAPQLLGFFLEQLLEYGTIGGRQVGLLVIACPVYAGLAARNSLLAAAVVAGKLPGDVLIVDDTVAIAAYFHHHQFDNLPKALPSTAATAVDTPPAEGEAAAPAPAVHCVVINIGHSSTSAVYLSGRQMSIEIIQQRSIPRGSREIDHAIAQHIFDHVASKNKFDVRGHCKSFNKVLRDARKAKEMLSTTEAVNVTIDALANDIDVQLSVRRADVEAWIKPFVEEVAALLRGLQVPQDVLAAGALRLEAIGGGWRFPILQQTIRQAFGVERIGVGLDCNLAVAEGAAIVGAMLRAQQASAMASAAPAADSLATSPASPASPPTPPASPIVYHSVHQASISALKGLRQPTPPSQASLDKWLSAEATLRQADDIRKARIVAKNKLESLILRTRDILPRCSLAPPQQQALEEKLNASEQWIWDDCDEAPASDIDTKCTALEAELQTNPHVAAFYEKEREIQRQRDAEFERLSREQQEEKEYKSDPQRLKAAQTRREQGQKLFKEEHFQEAQTRFVQALSILADLYDLNNEEAKQKRAEISLSCHLNIASCSIKLGMWRNAANNSTKALEFDGNNAKALFRRGQARFRLNELEEARKDLERARDLSGGDAGVLQELEAVKSAIEAEKAKEKKVFSKMFG